jgi:AraC-like DNA-binding protein
MSPTDFIRDIRLKKAAQLLLTQPEASITDIATRVGFATPKYFSRLFREKFGVAPKDYTGKDSPITPSSQPEE